MAADLISSSFRTHIGQRNQRTFSCEGRCPANHTFLRPARPQPFQFRLQQLAGSLHACWSVPIKERTVRSTHGPPVSPFHQFSSQEYGILQRLRPVIQPGENMTMTIDLHCCKFSKKDRDDGIGARSAAPYFHAYRVYRRT